METSNKRKRIYTENNLLKAGIIIFFGSLIGNIILSYFNESEFSSSITRFNDFTLIHFIAAFTIAPVLEELIFRGIFTGKKIFKYVMYLGSLLYIILLQNYYLIPILAIFIVAFELNRSKNIPYHIYYINAVLFGLMHYEFNDLKLLDTGIGIVMTSGMGLILIWMVLNFGLIYSILLHALNNFVAVAIIVLGNETADMNLKKVETQDFTMKYQRVSFFIKNGNMEVENNKSLKAENMSISNIHNALCSDEKLDDLYFGKFNVSIERKSNSTKKLNCESFHQLLNKTDLKEN
ncbi:CPBP family intramembrane glutamic endopeptidase [Chryseobacterium sp. CFS15]|uniref:CPBP family intramembrane glutamic endopeptidase n=1 Tax=Chryseobacterium sp. CFS15 TaxID=2986946 RepID=UPI002809BD64|nr:CPBP family intramembrane glutamic endopeptidase [Chryseobacterium sp. CFS15]MDQ8143989.1 CPBP family intramembrane glutamic endopeptidase [Chryseobacterium sp. CFS15]